MVALCSFQFIQLQLYFMTTKEAINFYGSRRAIAAQLTISYEAVRRWGKYPPLDRQFQLEVLSNGKLKADRSFAKESKKRF